MKVLRQLAALPPDTAACIGAFDGLHLGHQALLQRAAELRPRIALVTFDPHPARVLAPERAPVLLQSGGQRERVCAHLGVDHLVLLPFSRQMAAMEPERFAQAILIDGLRPAAVVVGEDFRFGAGRRGGTDELRDLLAPAAIDLAIVGEILIPGSPRKIGSSGIRAAIRAGEVAEAAALLGRCYAVEGEVVHGAGRGRGLGVPTANVACPDALLPRPGVYAAALQVVDRRSDLYGELWPAAANLGQSPTFGPGELALEVHALGVDLGERLYGVEVEVAFIERLRDEQRFADVDALKAAIAGDLAAARAIADAGRLATIWRPPADESLDRGRSA
ncbi:MAG: riboflavin biosynthesis protein RibF [Myxococcales bacterium]|nr:riboflavin biosynthesis protein RibF [Myxococcales bacterium]MCB9706113.1 riboflavin biosynthesis protein RibF [Myxococcales bacterium]